MTNSYQNGKIYKIADIGENKCYIGSTCQKLYDRMTGHRYDYKRYKKGLKHKIKSVELFEEYGLENCFIRLMEEYPCSNRKELNQREGFFINTMDCINKKVAGRSKEEYKDENKEWYKEYYRNYYAKNKQKQQQQLNDLKRNNPEKYKERKHNDYIKHKEKRQQMMKEYYERTKEERKQKLKEYRDTHKEHKRQYDKEYREKKKQQQPQ